MHYPIFEERMRMEQYYSQQASSILWNQFEKQLFGKRRLEKSPHFSGGRQYYSDTEDFFFKTLNKRKTTDNWSRTLTNSL